jgi:hypothetical protein
MRAAIGCACPDPNYVCSRSRAGRPAFGVGHGCVAQHGSVEVHDASRRLCGGNSQSAGAHQKIAICFIDWSGPFEQKLVVDWSVVDGIDTAVHLGDLISRAPRSFYNSTSIGSAIDFAATQIARAPFEAERHAIDVSGDGTNNSGRDLQFFRDRAVAQGIVVSGLVILTDIQLAQYPAHTNPPGCIEKYYRDNVIGGPGSFVMVAEDYNSFGRAMVRKLIAEIATAPADLRSASAEPQARRP